MLDVLSITNNNLHGSIPKEIFSIPTMLQISLSFNNLDGPLPSEVSNAKNLIYLQLSSNKLSGGIPNVLGTSESLEVIELDQNIFSGLIPTSLGNMSSLKFLNLSHNYLSGHIPVSLGNFQLVKLDLSMNHLNGEIPTNGIFRNATAARLEGNQGLCGGILEFHLPSCSMSPPNSTEHNRSALLKVVVPLTGSMMLLFVVTYVLFALRTKQKRKSISLPSPGRKFPRLSYNDLARATEGFSTSNLIGRGRYGSVYQGQLFQDGNVVTVKVFSLETRGAQKNFITECSSLRNMRHRNLVPILTACSSIDSNGNDFKALIYEFMPRGDLHKLLYSTEDDEDFSNLNQITLARRLSIVVDVADALEYLHHNNSVTIVHCDLKPSNILLDDNLTAHVGDFGLARFKADSTTLSFGDSVSTSPIAIKGTIGYVAPECATGGDVSSAVNVYSFGIVLLEIFLRKKPTHNMFKDGLNIAKFVEMNFPDRIAQIIDPELLEDLQRHDLAQQSLAAIEEKSLECLQSVLNIGLRYANPSPNERMDMREVAARLHRIKEAYLNGN